MSRGFGSAGAGDATIFALAAAESRTLFGENASAFRFLAITPLERPDLRLVQALRRQQTATAVDIGRNAAAWPGLFERLEREQAGLGLRLPEDTSGLAAEPPSSVSFLVTAGSIRDLPVAWRTLPVIAQVCSLAEAEKALGAGAGGLIAKGQESGGRAGDESSFVLLQRILAMTETLPVRVPVWCQGGIGLHTAAAAIAGGAFGVVLDSVLCGYPECGLPAELKSQILNLDGSEIRTVAGHQVFSPARDAALDELDASGVAERLALGETGPAPLLFAVGQDAALSQAALAECANVEALVNTLRQRVSAQLRQARRLKVLDEHNPWATSHGTRYPIAQGPMTRVSDTAAFATAVGQAGALPFLALALMQAEPSRRLLEETQAAAAGRPWGVGVLGFAPPEILEPQLQLIREFRPSALILAGGRPSQSRPFVEMGIPTYLHVPSPGLLELFLKDGATHFVFEGRECGGHVGPRFSFVLWEQAMARLMRHKHPERLHILFAGGIHDARSSAMVAAMAAPLAARGAKIGVLMGTAYIATAEAVSSGSILPRFQEKALASAATTLVETAPGHAIRCLPSGFVDLFEREKGRLRADGVEQRQAWLELETLTVGRLRVASKGVDRVDGVLSPVTAERQDAEGMYMIGQAIALKNAVITVAELHVQVSRGATEYLDRIEIPALKRAEQAEPVAIVGMACVYPGSPDLESFWTNIVEGGDFIREVPEERWSAAAYWQPAPASPGKTPSKWGGFVDELPFDPVEFGIPPASVAAVEPAQLMALETARKALVDAGYVDRWFDREKTAVIFGTEGGMELSQQYSFRNLYTHYMGAELPAALAESLPVLTEDSFAGVLGNVIAGRIANRLGLGGVNYAVDSACASSLTAIELGVKELRGGSSDMVLAGGADFHNGITDFLMFASVGALSAKGRCRPFDNQADGIALGEGVGVLVMKRLSDAERDGDRIYAVIDAVAGSSDGKALGLTAPRREGQRRALDRAYWQAGVLPAEIGLMEAHGTGTVVGDRTELETLTDVFTAGGAIPGQTQLGSVKSQIGHTKCAAGIAGVIKVAKALHHRVLPATQQITTPNAAFHGSESPFRLSRKATPWVATDNEKPRAAVSAFGFGGTNFHAVLSAHAARGNENGAVAFPAELFAFRGVDRTAAEATLVSLQRFLAESDAPLQMRDLAHTAWAAKDGPVQVAFVAKDRNDLSRSIAAALAGSGDGAIHRRATSGLKADGPAGVAALFGGQGSQYPNMLADLFVYFPGWLQDLLAEGETVLPALYPPTAYDEPTRQSQERALADTRNAQPALGLVEFAAFRWLARLGLRPDMAAGHSYGELVALASAGAFDFADLMRLSRARARAMAGSVTGDAGLMAAIRLDAGALEPLLADFPTVVIANRNSPIQSVIAGPTPDVRAACAFLTKQSVGLKVLDTDRAFHSPLMAKSRQRFAEALAVQTFAKPQWPVYTNVNAGPHGSAEEIRATLAQHLVSPVMFTEEVERMYADGARVFIDFGPRQVLAGLVGRILKDRPHSIVAVDQPDKGLSGLLDAAARLAVTLPGFDAGPLFEGRSAALDLDRPRKLSNTTWMIDGAAARPLSGSRSARRQVVVPTSVAPSMPATAGEDALVAYLSNMREVVRAQRDVLLGYFGAPVDRTPAVSVAPPRPIEVAAATAVPSKVPVSAAGVDFEALLLQIIGERTGYPTDKLDADLDLEADLSIDSIKRLEIIGDLADRLNLRERLGEQSDTMLEQLASLKTLRAMLAVLTENLPVAQGPGAISVSTLLPEIVSQCTGYPLDALDADLDLEADLSIDSIKRIEIIGQLMARLGVEDSGDRDDMLEQLSALKTLRAMIGWIDERIGGAARKLAPAVPLLEAAGEEAWPLRRYVLRQRDAEPVGSGAADLAGLRFLITDDGLGVAPIVAASLEARGARPQVVDFRTLVSLPDEARRVDGLMHLRSLNPASGVDEVKQFFAVARDSLLAGAGHLLVAEAGASPGRGGGFAGMVKTLSKEFPALHAHWVELETSEAAATLAGYVERELLTDEPLTEVRYTAGRRLAQHVVPVELDSRATDGMPLDRDSVVLLIGGARGITASLAVALAHRYQCRLELAGRSEIPTAPESELTRGISDPRQLRQLILGAEPALRPAEVEARLRRLLAERDIAKTLDQVRLAGSEVHYTQVDVRDEARFADLIADVYARRGRIDGVIHGAGVVEDKLVRDKTPESFSRVFDTKVAPAMMLRKLIRDDVKFVVFFSSVAAAFGNRGQVDYASANDVLDKLARNWQSGIKGRVLSVNWGPWADTGMVSESLRNDYQRRGIGLIPQRDGIDALLRELSAPVGESQVVLMCGNPESFGVRPMPAVRAA
jgi:acyl transferase domain-containing protein/NAD(P)H-dependent flavin oxidoreductase YrpB (nitropropane dioxygenase family)/acyl carrier protein